MDNRKQALTDLLAKVEAGDATMVDIHAVLQRNGLNATSAYNGSLDAAMALHETVLPGWRYFGGLSVVSDGYLYTVYHPEFYDCEAASNNNPARAWLMAIIKALIAEETE